MSAYFKCDQCKNEIADPRELFVVYAATTNVVPTVVDRLHHGELCIACINAIKAVLPQEEEEGVATQVVRSQRRVLRRTR